MTLTGRAERLSSRSTAPDLASNAAAGLPGFTAALCLIVVVIHLEDQNWLSFAKTPVYVQFGYVAIEVVGLVTAWLLVTRPTKLCGVLGFGVGLSPLVGYILSRGTGLPSYSDDKGAWSEPLGVVSLVVEGILIIASVVVFTAREQGVARQTWVGAK